MFISRFVTIDKLRCSAIEQPSQAASCIQSHSHAEAILDTKHHHSKPNEHKIRRIRKYLCTSQRSRRCCHGYFEQHVHRRRGHQFGFLRVVGTILLPVIGQSIALTVESVTVYWLASRRGACSITNASMSLIQYSSANSSTATDTLNLCFDNIPIRYQISKSM